MLSTIQANYLTSIIICDKLITANTDDCLTVILHIIKTNISSHLNFNVAPQLSKLLLFREIIKIPPCCHLAAVISSSLNLIRKNITNCVQATKLSEDNISSDKKTTNLHRGKLS